MGAIMKGVLGALLFLVGMRVSLVALLVLIASPVLAQGVLRGPGGPVTTVPTTAGGVPQTAGAFTLNNGSTLQRQWVTINDPAIPATFSRLTGATTRSQGNSYTYFADIDFQVTAPLAAIQFNWILFDLWGRTMQVQTFTQVKDYPIGTQTFGFSWIASEARDVQRYFASITYIARVRTMDGKVIEVNQALVEAEALKLDAGFKTRNISIQP